MLKKSLFALFLSLLFLSCGNNFLYEKDIALPENVWRYDNAAVFSFDIEDSAALYNLYFDLAHAVDFKTQNLYVKFYTTTPSGKITEDLVSLELAGKDGVWFGDCGGEKCTLSIPLQNNAYFAETGTYELRAEQYSRTEALPGVYSVGFSIEKTDKKRQ